MPGIAGIISKKPGQPNQRALATMIAAMCHETFYSTGDYQNEQLGVYVGWSVHAGSFADCLPIYNPTKDIVLIFYGENHIDCSPPEKPGTEFNTRNASCLIQLYEDDEKEFLRNLNGWFNGLLIDLRRQKIILFNDRYGMQRLYVHEELDAVYFASEAKCILKAKPALRNIPNESLAELLGMRCILGNRSLFQDVHLLPGGSCWEFRCGEINSRHHYFEPDEYENMAQLGKESFYPRLQEVFQKILPRYFSAAGRIAFSLTGGMDTRTVLANIKEPLVNVHSYSHSGAYRDCYDVTIAREVAKVCGLSHDTLRLDNQFIAEFPSLAEKTVYITDGYMDLNGTPSLYLHGKARQIGDIRFTGNFGDQVLVNRINLKPSSGKMNFLNNDFEASLNDANNRLKDMGGGNPLTFFLFKQAPWFDYSRFSLEQSQMIQRTPFMDNELISLLYQAPVGMLEAEDVRCRLIREGNPALAKIHTEKGYLGDSNPLASRCLRVYRKFLFQGEYYFSYGMPHWLARLNNLFRFLQLENLLLDRNKYYNLRRLFRYELSGYVREILLDDKTLNRPFINKKYVEKMVCDHVGGRGNYTNEINLLLSTELTFRLLIDNC